MSDHDDGHAGHDQPPRTIREVLGRATVITGIASFGVWLVAAAYSAVVMVTLLVEGDSAAVAFAVVELGAALVVIGALAIFATAGVFLATHAARALRRPTTDRTPSEEDTSS